jgi:hypothetical protein
MKLTTLLGTIALATASVAGTANGQPAADSTVTVPAATLLSYAGKYSTDRGMEAIVALQLDGDLTIELNSPPLRLRPVSQTEFAVDEKKARVAFRSDNGKVSGLTIRMWSRELHATRVN